MRINPGCRTARRAVALACLLAIGVSLAGCGGKSSTTTTVGATAKITVTPQQAFISPNQQLEFSATAQDSSGNTVTTARFSWTSSAPNVASIDGNGLALGRSNGSTQITASAAGASAVVTSAPATLTVAQPIASITISPRSATIAVNGTQPFAAAAIDANGNAIAGVTFTWACSFSGVATIDSNGLATGVSPGMVTIFASAGGVTSPLATLTVTP
jgi:Big-like domain-containing protein